jgi:hypothetical protein
MQILGQAVPDPSTLLPLSERLAQQTDRVLFISALLIGMAFCYWVIKYLVKRNDELTAKVELIANEAISTNKEMSKSIDRMAIAIDKNSEFLGHIKAKMLIPSMAIMAFYMAGCAKFSGYTEREFSQDGKISSERVHMRAYTLFDGKAEVAKAKSLQTDKTQSVGIQDTKQESKADVIPNTIKAAGESGFIKPLIP